MGINLLLSVEPIEVFFGILIIIGSVLSIILFFKIWKMTNNVQEILDLLEYRIAPDVNALSNIKTKESQSKESGNLIGQSYTDDDDLIGQFYGEARQLQLSLLSCLPDINRDKRLIFNRLSAF